MAFPNNNDRFLPDLSLELTMGVIVNLFCIRRGGPSPSTMEQVADMLCARDLVRDDLAFFSPAERDGRLLYPWSTATFDEHGLGRTHWDGDAALPRVRSGADGMLRLGPLNERHPDVRRDFDGYRGSECVVALYRFTGGHRLVLREPEDFSDVIDDIPELATIEQPPAFEQIAYEWLLLHGKAAPVAESFEGSALHRAIAEMWPDPIVVEDCWL